RIGSIAVHPENKQTWYIGVSSGGVWKTTNAGITFTPVFQNEGSYGRLSVDSTSSRSFPLSREQPRNFSRWDPTRRRSRALGRRRVLGQQARSAARRPKRIRGAVPSTVFPAALNAQRSEMSGRIAALGSDGRRSTSLRFGDSVAAH